MQPYIPELYAENCYSLSAILVVADLVVQYCTKSATTNIEWREYILIVTLSSALPDAPLSLGELGSDPAARVLVAAAGCLALYPWR